MDEKLWTTISNINEEEGGVAYSKQIKVIGKKLKLGKQELELLINSLLEQKLVHKLLQIVCHRCGAPNLRVDASTDVKTLLKSIRCGVCNGVFKSSDIIEVFVLPQDVIRLVNGLWLEEYVKDIVENECSRVWQGRYLGNDELDVVGLKLGSVFLFECKTTEIGHTDVYNLVIKARRLGADASFIVTTKKVVENAKKAIDELSRTEGMNIYMVEGNRESIRNGVLKHLEKEINDKLKTLILLAMGVPIHRYGETVIRRYRRSYR